MRFSGSAIVSSLPRGIRTNNISAFTINAGNGKISAISRSPFTAGTTPSTVAVDHSGRFAYVANTGSTNVSEYTINSGTGALSPISGSPITTTNPPVLVTVDPSGRFAYVGNGADISAYTINTSTGALTLVSGSTLSTAEQPTGAAVDPTGQFLYVTAPPASGNGGYISIFTIDPSTGALAAISGSPFSTAEVNYPAGVAIDASNRFAYVTNQIMVNSNYYMSGFAIDAGAGALTFLNYTPALGAGTYGVAADPLGQFVYATQNVVNDLVALSLNSPTDTFTRLNSDVCIVDTAPVSITVDPSGKFAYVANVGANDVTACAINQTTGVLSNISGDDKVAAGMSPISVATTGTIH
jgi:6-phosphogluconolactonase